MFLFHAFCIIGARWAVVQSDNRDESMVRLSTQSFKSFSDSIGASHYVFDCNVKSWMKPALTKFVCKNTEYLLYADSDSIAKKENASKFIEKSERIFHRNKSLFILLGVDFSSTINQVRNRQSTFIGYFNAGLFVVDCKRADYLLTQWAHYTKYMEMGDDQRALQDMADHSSIWSKHIQYDFMLLGVHSKYFSHFPGAYRHKFPSGKAPNPNKLKCPMVQF